MKIEKRKRIGESSITAAAPAVVNAMRDAIGACIYQVPAAPERIFRVFANK